MPEPEELEKSGNRAVAAIVVSLEFENWLDVQAAVERAGGRILYRRLAPPWTFFRVVAEEEHPNDVARRGEAP